MYKKAVLILPNVSYATLSRKEKGTDSKRNSQGTISMQREWLQSKNKLYSHLQIGCYLMADQHNYESQTQQKKQMTKFAEEKEDHGKQGSQH
eukprot:10519926-Ditylum_brightwellii.AAC.1